MGIVYRQSTGPDSPSSRPAIGRVTPRTGVETRVAHCARDGRSTGSTVCIAARRALLMDATTSDVHVPRRAVASGTVGVLTMGNPHDGDGHDVVPDRVEDAVLTPSSRPQICQFTSQGPADTSGILRERSCDELRGSRCDVLRKPVLQSPTCRRRDGDPIGHCREIRT